MSVFLTPELKPFFGGTYFPPTSRWGRPGFRICLASSPRCGKTIGRESNRRPPNCSSGSRSSPVRERTVGESRPSPERDALEIAVDSYRKSFDERHGGFGDAPKFPRPAELLFLLREHARRSASGDLEQTALKMVTATLRAMAMGGMRDHLGGGFHRYSVDAEWRVPHFEKMLYDQAQLALAYLEAAQATGDDFYATVAEDTLAYVMRDLTDRDGGFLSAEDADSIPPEAAGDPSARTSPKARSTSGPIARSPP